MSTFLQLFQKAARDSGTISGTPASVTTGLTSREAKLVSYVAEAWDVIQNAESEWLWMQREFTSTAVTSVSARYTAAQLGVNDWSEWLLPYADRGRVTRRFSIYKTANGVGNEVPINYIPFELYLERYERGVQTPSTPSHYSIASDGKLCFGPIPDADHTVKGFYRKLNQVLALDGDTPEFPVRFHNMISHKALVILAEHDEATFPVAAEHRKYIELKTALEISQLFRGRPIITSAPLA